MTTEQTAIGAAYAAEAQTAHMGGDYSTAITLWRHAQGLVGPETLENATWMRGEASSTFRRGDTEQGDYRKAEWLARSALDSHVKLASEANEHPVIREVPESTRVLGRMILLETLRSDPDAVVDEARTIMEKADDAVEQMRKMAGGTDEHENNWWPTRAVAEALGGGSKKLAREQARAGLRTSGLTRALNTTMNLGINQDHAVKPSWRGRARAFAARVIVELSTPQPSRRRRAAVWLATRDRLI